MRMKNNHCVLFSDMIKKATLGKYCYKQYKLVFTIAHANPQEYKSALRKVSSTGGTIRIAQAKPNTLDTADYSFAKFAATYFNSNATGSFSRKPLKKSLLEHALPIDDIAAQAIWIMILRFMGDIPEATSDHETENNFAIQREDADDIIGSTKSSIMKRLTMTCSKNEEQSRGFQEALSTFGSTKFANQQPHLIRNTLQRKTKLPDILRKSLEKSDEIEYYQKVLHFRSNNLEKLHFIIGHGILKPGLRDEILSQICKQLTNNTNRTSTIRGWNLLSLCLGCFSPSTCFENFLRCFIRSGPVLYGSNCEDRLDRTLKNGARRQPPSRLELQSVCNRLPIKVKIFLMDGDVQKIQIDSASTASEVVQQLAEHIGLVDHFGFSIVMKCYGNELSLGAGHEHINDAISNCEQYAKERGQHETTAPWQLFLKKEMFSPWYDPSMDPVATHLIYKQIIRGLNCGEYRCRNAKDIAMICALQYYVEQGGELILRKLLCDFVPKDFLITGEESWTTWQSLIMEAYRTNKYVKQRAPKQHAMEDICLFALLTWPMFFSRCFEAVRIVGPKLLTDNLVIAINSEGICYIDETEQVLAQYSYTELAEVSFVSADNVSIDELHIETVQEENFTFKCYEARDVSALLNYMLKQLKERSIYGVAVECFKPEMEEADGRFFLLKGDLVEFDAGVTGAKVLSGDARWLSGVCNGVKGDFPVDAVDVLAALTKPPQRVLQMYKDCKDQVLPSIKTNKSRYNTMQRQRMYTLRVFAEEHFRPNIRSGLISQPEVPVVKATDEKLWRHSCNMLKAPLLKSLQRDLGNFQQALVMFYNILKYMGDTPCGKQTFNTDFIFKPALLCETLRDELYCQIMKQLTENRLQHSEERGWDLMYLATGLMYPGSLIMKELLQFLRTRTHVLSGESLKRVKRTLLNGMRKRPPHSIEVEGIQQRFMHIYHKLYFPDGSVEAFEVESHTRSVDLAQDITQRFQLRSHDGFSLFAKIGDKVLSVPAQEFVFDYIVELEDGLKQNLPRRCNRTQCDCQYQLYYMKKLWLNSVPGRDRNADIIFYYPQEVPKYLSGYYKVDKKLAIAMAAYIYVVGFGLSLASLQNIGDVLPYLVPQDVIPLLKEQDWKRHITLRIKALIEQGNVDEVNARQCFLTQLTQQQMCGSTFFVVNQNSEHNLPNTLLIAINRYGFHILHHKTKEILHSYNYSELNFWSYGNTYFHISFGNMIGASKFLCRTTLGYKMDDLLSSYVKYLNSK